MNAEEPNRPALVGKCGSILAMIGVGVMLFAIWKWSVAPKGDIDAGNDQPVVARLSASQLFIAGGVMGIIGSVCRYVSRRKSTS